MKVLFLLNTVCYFLLCNRLSQKFGGLKPQHLLSHSFCGSTMWMQFNWVIWLWVSHAAAIKVLAEAAVISRLDWGGATSKLLP